MTADENQLVGGESSSTTTTTTTTTILEPAAETCKQQTPEQQQQEEAAMEAGHQLSLTSKSPVLKTTVVNGDVAELGAFDPKPTIMSRGDSSGEEDWEDIHHSSNSSSSGGSDDTAEHGNDFCSTICHELTATGPAKKQLRQQQQQSAFVTPPRNSSSSSSTKNSKDKIVLKALHQHRLAENNTNGTNSSSRRSSRRSSDNYNNTQGTEERDASSSLSSPPPGGGVGVNKVLLAPILGAWGWIQRQNEKKKEHHLKLLAEQQVRKLKQAEKSDPSINFTVVVDDNSTGSVSGENHRHSNGESCSTTPTTGAPATATTLEATPSDDDDESDDDISWIPAVRCVEERVKKDFSPSPRASITCTDPTKPVPYLLSPEQMHDVARFVLPKGIAFCRWKRLYSLTRDGDSFFQCLRLCGDEPKTLMVIKTTRGAILGGYADAPWELQTTHAHGAFHGSAQACLFSFSIPNDDDDNNSSSKDDQQQQPTYNGNDNNNNKKKTKTKKPIIPSTNLRVFHWTGANRYIQYTDTSENRRMLAFGGGGQEGSFGLCVEQDFQLGSTGPCDTFGNVPLCDQENFNIMDLEIWGFLTGQF